MDLNHGKAWMLICHDDRIIKSYMQSFDGRNPEVMNSDHVYNPALALGLSGFYHGRGYDI